MHSSSERAAQVSQQARRLPVEPDKCQWARIFAVPSGGGPRLLVRPPAEAFTEAEVAGKLFYTSSETGNPLVESYAVDVADAFIFHDGFESADTSRWTVTVP
ncbi:MAG: hypothetical protein AAGM22_19665 [Acidobacteriota bacterium]